MPRIQSAFLLLIALSPAAAAAAQADRLSSRELSEINWMEFREFVPAKVNTVLLPTGTLEAHGVINNGADILAPVAIAQKIAEEVNALVAPAIPYGMTGSLDAYPGSFTVSEEAYRAYAREVIRGMAKMGFRNIVVINGHGLNQGKILGQLAAEVGQTMKVRTLVINWWALTADITLEVFGEDGGHAGWNENAMIQAINPRLVQKHRYSDALAAPLPAPDAYFTYPSATSIMLYKEGEGYVKFDQAKADEYFRKVCAKVAKLIVETRRLWDAADV